MLKKWKYSLISLIFAIIIIIALIFSKSIAAGVKNGIELCLNILIPSMFCFLVFTDFAVKTGIIGPFLKPLGVFLKYVFRLDPRLSDVFLFSLIGGYPIGAKLISDYVREGELDVKTAERMLCFCVNSGPAFVISAVGGVVFSDISIGAAIFFSHILASLTCGFLSGFSVKEREYEALKTPAVKAIPGIKKRVKTFPAQMVNSVFSSAKVIVNICALVLLFSGVVSVLNTTGIISKISSVFDEFLPHGLANAVITGSIEITNGIHLCAGTDGITGVVAACAITAFGGICIHAQIFSIISGTGIRMVKFYIYRLIYIIISCVSILFIIKTFDIVIPAFTQIKYEEITRSISGSWIVKPWSDSLPASIFLIILCIFLLLSCKKSDKIKSY